MASHVDFPIFRSLVKAFHFIQIISLNHEPNYTNLVYSLHRMLEAVSNHRIYTSKIRIFILMVNLCRLHKSVQLSVIYAAVI